MKTKLVSTLIAAPLLALSSLASAAEPMQLEAAQMDGVTAGVFGAGGNAIALATGTLVAATQTIATGTVVVLGIVPATPTSIAYVSSTSGARSQSGSL